jgi:hypothetical protein
MSRITASIGIAAVLFGAACVKEGENRAVRPAARGAERPRTKKLPSSPPLPKVAAPDPVAAERVVDLFYTSNVAGEADPCG